MNNPDRKGTDQVPEKPPDRNQPDKQESGQANAPMKGTDIPATTDLESIEREKGKRTTM